MEAKAKDKLFILNCIYMAEEKEKPFVIEKSARLHAFKNLDLLTLSINWFSNKKY